ncbi:ATPase, AAA family domain containing protein, putative [Babesia bigemina]|uniref:ATPase, AAA family domain containing protein, putative n=1 Tax=Babesia bigemina TaxID=5866 RepID=A0A061D6G6_BABBI|nr:ATPase, AAA family domain containing protein, putative [Babesia bigemina]CDR96148.1 ATPase, AAA family domain containing protein, putative [Babesia bigemina]|eukprot:XP_012768334.1 ATPase, AAA family domain containing protein, putative [Babesia bigemina]
MENVAIKLAAAAARERIPVEYAARYTDLLLEESRNRNDSNADSYHADTIHDTVSDFLLQFEEKIALNLDATVAELRPDLSNVQHRRNRYTSIYDSSTSDSAVLTGASSITGSRRQCLKSFFDGKSFVGSIPLKNAARRYILGELELDAVRNIARLSGLRARQTRVAASNAVGAQNGAVSTPATATPSVAPASRDASTNVATASQPTSKSTESRVSGGVANAVPPEASPVISRPEIKPTPKAAQPKQDPPAYLNTKKEISESHGATKDDEPNPSGTVKRQWEAGATKAATDGTRLAAKNTKRTNNTDPGFKSGMDVLVNDCEEKKAPLNIGSDKPRQSCGLSYPSKTNLNSLVTSGNTNQSSKQKPPVDERYVPLVGADLTPEIINVVLNMKLDASLYNICEADIAGLNEVKKTLKDKVVQPIMRPDLHTGLLRAPKGVLLFGPPGTGKTTLAKWIANLSRANCFEVSPSSITSKFHGESESIIKALFKVAHFDSPSIIFIDEVDAVLGKRSTNEADLSIRMKNQLLQMMDGLHCGTNDGTVVVIAATNRPMMLDDAALRRFGKRVLIPLPDLETRKAFLHDTLRKNCNGNCELSSDELDQIAASTEGWNGSDLLALCTKAAEYSYDDTVEAYGGIENIPDASVFRGLVIDDFIRALRRVRPSNAASSDFSFEEWQRLYGSH